MANNQPCTLNVSATFGSAVGNCQGFSYSGSEQLVAIADQDSIYDDTLALVGESFTAEVMSLHTPITRGQSSASLVLVERQNNGGSTITHTITNMYCYDIEVGRGGKGDLTLYRYKFRSKGHSVLTIAQESDA